MTFWVMLITLFSFATVILAYSMVVVCTFVAIFAIYYSFVKRIKRLRVFSRILKKFKKSQAPFLSSYEKEIAEKNSAFDMEATPLSFRESLVLSGKDYKRLFIFSLLLFVIIFVPFLLTGIVVGREIQSAIQDGMNMSQAVQHFIVTHPVCFLTYAFTGVFVALVLAFLAFSLPVILMLYAILNQRVKKMGKRLEKLVAVETKPINF